MRKNPNFLNRVVAFFLYVSALLLLYTDVQCAKKPKPHSMAAGATPGYYVSGATGNDSWSGTLAAPNSANTDGPFKTIGKAQSAMRGSSAKSVALRAGTYLLSSNWPFDWSDAGESWMAYTGENPLLDGGGKSIITLTGVKNLTFQGLTFQNTGVGGIVVNGARGTSFLGNIFNNCNTNCLSGGGFSGSVIDSNTINSQTSVDSAIKFWYGSGNDRVTHNLIQNCQGGGINFGTGKNDPVANNVIIDRNILINVNTTSYDQGAIYVVDQTHLEVGYQITNNVIRGNGGGSLTSFVKAIYLDDLTSNTLVSGNTCSGCGQYAFQIHGGDKNTITNNIFDLTSGAQAGFYQASPLGDYGMTANVITKNIVYSGGVLAAPLNRLEVNSGDAPPQGSQNLYHSHAVGAPKPLVPNDSSPVYGDPQFTNPSAGDYSMPASSPAYTQIGFQPLPTDQGPVGSPFLSGSGKGSF